MSPHSSFAEVPRRLVLAALAAICALTGLIAPALADAAPVKLKVMSRNIYLGSELTSALTAPNQVELYEEAGKVWRNMQETNFVARARVLANEIEARRPALIGLQEVAVWRRGPRGTVDGPETPAREVYYDFLQELKAVLENRDLGYRVVSVQREADLELPLDFQDDSTPQPVYDGRLTQRDVVLARNGVQIDARESENFGSTLNAPTAAGPIPVKRGYNSVDVTVQGASFRFVNTHLEAFNDSFRELQANELINGPLDTRKRVVVVGDLNSDPNLPSGGSNSNPDPDQDAYNIVAGAGFVDRGAGVPTCCHDDDLLNAVASFVVRIDHVLSRGRGIRQLGATVVGDEQGNRTPAGLWPSDHGGVVSRLSIQR